MNLITILGIAFTIIYTISSALAIILRKKVEICIPITILSSTLVIYLFSFYRKTNIGVYIVFSICIIAFVFLLYKIIRAVKNKLLREIIYELITPGVLAYVIFWGIYVLINHSRALDSDNAYIFEYIFVKILNLQREDGVIIAYNIINISLIIPVFQNVKWRDSFVKLPLYMPLIFLVPLGFFSNTYVIPFSTLTSGIAMSYILYTYFSEKDNSRYIGICMGLIILSIIHPIGIELSFLAIIIILFDFIVFKLKDVPIRKVISKKIAVLLLLMLCILVGRKLWSMQLKEININDEWNISRSDIGNMKRIFSKNGEEYQYELIGRFKEQFFEMKMDVNYVDITNFSIVLIYIVYSVITCNITKFNHPDDKIYKEFIVGSGVLVICYAIYMVSLMNMYLDRYSQYGVIDFSSYGQYSNMYLVGMFMFNTMFMIDSIKDVKKNKISLVMIVSILIFIYPSETIKYMLNIRN